MFLNDWSESGFFGMVMDFEGGCHITKAEFYGTEELPLGWSEEYKRKMFDKAKKALEKYKDVEVILASYTYYNYCGSAFVLFKKDGKLFEVNGGRCSYYELEGQWEPEETTVDSLRHRLEHGSCDFDGCSKELGKLLLSL